MRSVRWVVGVGVVGLLGVQGVALAATFYVDATAGDDSRTSADAQSAATPWKTLTRATTEATLAAGDQITVAPGLYDESGGETFPLHMINGVAIQGAGIGTQIVTGSDSVFDTRETNLGAGTRLSDVYLGTTGYADSLIYFYNLTGQNTPLITNTTFGGNGDHGLLLSLSSSGTGSFSGTISNNSFEADLRGIAVDYYGNGDFSPTIDNNTFTDVREVMSISKYYGTQGGNFTPLISNNTATNSTNSGISLSLGSAFGSTYFAPIIDRNVLLTTHTDGVAVALTGVYSDATFSPTISNNTVTDPTGDGVFVYNSAVTSSGTLMGNVTVSGNTVTGAGNNGISLYMSTMSYGGIVDIGFNVVNNTVTNSGVTGVNVDTRSMQGLHGDLAYTIAGNTITGTGTGEGGGITLSIDSLSEADFGLDVLIAGNTITDAAYDGMYLHMSSASSLTRNDWTVTDNIVSDCGEDGIDYNLFSSDGTAGKFERNQLTGNLTAVHVGGAGVVPDFGGGALGSTGGNTFLDSAGDFDFQNDATGDVMARGNWWGTIVFDDIEARIQDDLDDSYWGLVDIGGQLAAEPSLTADLNVLPAIQDDVAPAGLSVGDTVRYTAFASATGQAGCVNAAIEGLVPDGTTLQASSVILTGANAAATAITSDVGRAFGALVPGTPVTLQWDVVVGAVADCTELTVSATLHCGPIPVDLVSSVTETVFGVEIANDGIDQDCDGADLVTITDTDVPDTDVADTDVVPDTDVVADTDVANDTDVAADTDVVADTDGGATDDTDVAGPKTGCGCDNTAPVGATWIMGLAAVGLLRRRRA